MLNTGIFPSQLKISKVIPLHKANDETLLSNYRPIALLPSVSKIFENVMLDQISNYFIDNNLLSMCCVKTIIPLYICITFTVYR